MKFRYSDFLWKQLDGPRAQSIFAGIYRYFSNLLQQPLDYFDMITLEKASTEHLDLLGFMLGVPRPYIWGDDTSNVWLRFAEDALLSDQGLSDPDTLPGIGGLLSEEHREFNSVTRFAIDDDTYRRILVAVRDSPGGIGSLCLLDEITSLFFDPDEYVVTYPTNLPGGDLVIDLTRYDQYAYLILLQIFRLWSPNTHVLLNVTPGGD